MAGKGAYQFMRDLTPEEYTALRDSIAQNGVTQPIVVDENGNILDGHHRKRAADELLVTCPEIVKRGLSEDEKVTIAFANNLARRLQSRDDKVAYVDASLSDSPHLADVVHAERCAVSRNKVRERREALGIPPAAQVNRERIRAYADEHGYGREGGPSQRAIAEALGVSERTVFDEIGVPQECTEGQICGTGQPAPELEPAPTGQPDPEPAPTEPGPEPAPQAPPPQPARKARVKPADKTVEDAARGIVQQVQGLTNALERFYQRDDYRGNPDEADAILADALENLIQTIEEKEA